MARVRVAIPDEDINAALSQKVAKILGEEQPEVSPPPQKKRPIPKPPLKKVAIGFAVFVAMIIVIAIVRDRNQLQGEVNKLSSSSTATPAQDEIVQLVDRLSQFMELPTDETPTLATVEDVESLKTQAFFVNAQNGDKVLLYAKSGKAILYRPSTRKLIEVSPIDTKTNTQVQKSN